MGVEIICLVKILSDSENPYREISVSLKDVKKYATKSENSNYNLHQFDLPFRSLVIAPSGRGKRNFICNLISLFCKGKVGTFDNIHIFCKCRDEPLFYRFLTDKSKGLIEIHENLDTLPPINELKPTEQTLLIFDAFITDIKKHPIISEYFIRGRKRNCSINFLSQFYYGTPKIIRQNVSYLVVLKLGGSRDVSSFLRECSVDLTKEELLHMYNDATREKFNCFIINLDKSGNDKYRHNFLEYYHID
jgi:hypothetical protein